MATYLPIATIITPVAPDSSLVVMRSLIFMYDLKRRHLDVKIALLNSLLEHGVRVFDGYGNPSEHVHAKLHTSLYDFKQITRHWYVLRHAATLRHLIRICERRFVFAHAFAA